MGVIKMGGHPVSQSVIPILVLRKGLTKMGVTKNFILFSDFWIVVTA